MNENKPEWLDSAKDKIGSVIDDKTTLTTQDRETTTEGGIINYGKPYTPFECSSDVQCITYFSDIVGIKCNLQTGECFVGG